MRNFIWWFRKMLYDFFFNSRVDVKILEYWRLVLYIKFSNFFGVFLYIFVLIIGVKELKGLYIEGS